ncbi:DUF6461 domain-containing protein [Spirillospora sp. NPDC127200]
MRTIGFAFTGDEGEKRPIAKAFALAEHITGVPLTEEAFEEAVHLPGLVEDRLRAVPVRACRGRSGLRPPPAGRRSGRA